MTSYVPEKGEIIEVDFDEPDGRRSRRLVLVMSPKAFNARLGLSWVSPITFIKSRHLFQMDLPQSLKTFGTVKIEEVFSVDFVERKALLVEEVPAAFIQRCQTAAGRVLGF